MIKKIKYHYHYLLICHLFSFTFSSSRIQVELVLEVEKFIPRRFRRHNFFQNSIKEVIRIGKPVDWVARLKSHPASLNAIEEAKSQSKVGFHNKYTKCNR